MTREQFLAYVDDYNSLDTQRLFRHYHPDLVFENFGARRAGPEAFQFLEGLHHVVADHLKPLNVLVDGDRIALEAEGTIRALKDLPDLPAGALKKDQTVRVRMFAFYDTEGPLITRVRVAGWPPVAAS